MYSNLVSELLMEELNARNMSHAEFAELSGIDESVIHELIGGTRSLTAESANLIGRALGTSTEIWLGLQD